MTTKSTERFSSRVEEYARFRPRYPEALVDTLSRLAGLRSGQTVADIGCGTGLSSEPLLRNGNIVIGVEPNDAMRRAADRAFAGNDRFSSVAGTAESTGLAEASVDLVLCAHAFHWFNAALAMAEMRRIVTSRGPIVVLWHARRIDGTDEAVEFEALLNRFGTDYAEIRHDRYDDDVMDVVFGESCVHACIEQTEWLDAETLRGRLLSFSYMPGPDDPTRERMLQALATLFETHAVDGRFRLDYRTEIHIGR